MAFPPHPAFGHPLPKGARGSFRRAPSAARAERSPSPPRGEVARRAGEGLAGNGISPSPGLRPPSPQRGEAVFSADHFRGPRQTLPLSPAGRGRPEGG